MFPVKNCKGYSYIACLLAIIFVFSFGACTKKKKSGNPAEVLEAYIKVAINAKNANDRNILYEYTTGNALARLKQMTDEEFIQSLVKPQYKFVHFSTRDQREEKPGTTSLIYELVYENTAGNAGARITNRKIAYLVLDEAGNWKIEDTRNVKSFVEVKEGLSVQYP